MNEETPKLKSSSKTKTRTSSLGKPVVSWPVLVGIVIAVGTIAFTGGMVLSKDQQNSANGPVMAMNANGGSTFGGGFGTRGMRGAMNGSVGEVTSVSTSSITVKSIRSGTSSTYTIDGNTKVVNGSSSASISDVKTGDTVLVQASSSDKTIATRIVINFGSGPQTQQVNPGGSDESGTSTSGDNI